MELNWYAGIYFVLCIRSLAIICFLTFLNGPLEVQNKFVWPSVSLKLPIAWSRTMFGKILGVQILST